MKTKSNTFLPEEQSTWEVCGQGIRRQIMGYDPHLMVVKVAFEKGAIGTMHDHYHTQASYIVNGRFEVTVEGERQEMGAGDGYYVESGQTHGVLCLEAGVLIDIFTPLRAEFLKG